MLRLFLNSGMYSATLWASLVFLVWSLVRFFRDGPAVPRVLFSRPVLALMCLVALMDLIGGIYKGYVSPRDLMQDIVSAQELLAGHSLYPDHMNDLMREALQRDPPYSLFQWLPAIREKETESLEVTLSQHWVQAHPPFMTVLVSPFVAVFGIGGTYAAMVLASLLSLGITLRYISRGLHLHLTGAALILILAALAGWDNLVMVFRCGQPGLILGGLLAMGWYLLRQGRTDLAGIPIGAAAALKMFPGLLLFYLLLRHRRTLLSSLITLVVFFIVTVFIAGWGAHLEHWATAKGVVEEYSAYPSNMSLLALVARFEGPPGSPHTTSPTIFYALAIFILAVVAIWVSRNPRQKGEVSNQFLDLEYSLLLTLMVLLSPVAWDHYLPILLLPLAVIGQRVFESSSKRSAALFAGVLFFLAVPDTTYLWIFDFFQGVWPHRLARLLFMPLRTYILAGLCFWLVRLAVRLPAATVLPEAIQQPTAETAPRMHFSFRISWLLPTLVVALVAGAHFLVDQPREPHWNNDETRHVMTGVFFRDLIHDGPTLHLKSYAESYYLQYPALGLLVWPPLFYGIEGLVMAIFGTSYPIARLVVAGFAVLALVTLFRLVKRTHGLTTATWACLFMGFTPLVFLYSHYVMLEVPTLALALVALFHAVRYLDEERTRDLIYCSLATAGTALMRYDGVFMAPLFLILLVGRGKLRLLLRPSVWLAVGGALLLVAPAYFVAASEIGGAHTKAIREGTDPNSSNLAALQKIVYYPSCIPDQVGWFVALAALVGLLHGLWRGPRTALWPYLALLGATYLTFTPMGELSPRHAIYWVPALVLFAAEGIRCLSSFLTLQYSYTPRVLSKFVATRFPAQLAQPLLSLLVTLGTAAFALSQTFHYVHGYDAVARHVVAGSEGERFCLFDGILNGTFIYQVRQLDPDRRLWVLRGDKILYGVLSEPHAGYQEWAKTEEDLLAVLDKHGPALLVVEDPQVFFHIPGGELLRQTLRTRTDRFALEAIYPLETNNRPFGKSQLLVYRNLARKTIGSSPLEVQMLNLGRTVKIPSPG